MRETIFLVQPFTAEKGKLIPVAPIAAKSEAEAKARVNRIRHRYAGVVAYSRIGDADLGEYDEPVILAKFGKLPPEIDDLLMF